MRCSWRRSRTQPGAPRTRSRPRWRPGREAPPPRVVALGTASPSWFQAPGPLASLRGAGPHHRCTPCGTTLRSWCRPRKATSPDGSCAWRPVCSEKAAFLHPLPQGGSYRRDSGAWHVHGPGHPLKSPVPHTWVACMTLENAGCHQNRTCSPGGDSSHLSSWPRGTPCPQGPRSMIPGVRSTAGPACLLTAAQVPAQPARSAPPSPFQPAPASRLQLSIQCNTYL